MKFLARAWAALALVGLGAVTFGVDARGATVTCGGVDPTKVGTEGRDVIRGTAGLDVIQALAGADRIRRLEPRDLVCAGGGRDRVKLPRGLSDPDDAPVALPPPPVPGEPPNTGVGLVLGGPGPDSIVIRCDLEAEWPPAWHPGVWDAWGQVWAEAGDDTIDTDCPYGDTLEGGPGDDLIRYGAGRDTALGNDGNDTLVDAYSLATDCGDPAPLPFEVPASIVDRRCVVMFWGPTHEQHVWYDWEDNAFGGPGDDLIVGGEANDLISGEDGDDLLGGGPGADALSGGPGNDACDGGEGDLDANQGEGGWAPLADCEAAAGFP